MRAPPRRRSISLVAAAVLAALLTAAPEASALDESTQISLFLGAVSGGLVGVPGIVVAAYNGGKDERPAGGWLAAGYVFGGLNLAAGGLYLVTAPQGDSIWWPGVGIGAGHVVMGIVDIAVTGVSGTKPDRSGSTAAVFPMPLWDAGGHASPGVGVQVRAF